MIHSILPHTFAIDADGKAVSISDVKNGQACNCSCPSCGEQLIARQGNIREWHFAHKSGEECPGGAESALHLAAKEIINQERRLLIPQIEGAGYEVTQSSLQRLSSVNTEVALRVASQEFRADLIVETAYEKIIVEIMVTHAVGDEKLALIKRAGVAALEIFIDPTENMEWSWATLKRVVVGDGPEAILNRVWLYHPAENSLVPAHKPSLRTTAKFRFRGVPVNLTKHDWGGLVLWHPYTKFDVHMEIKMIVQSFGGRWNAPYKNWLMGYDSKMTDIVTTLLKAGAERIDTN